MEEQQLWTKSQRLEIHSDCTGSSPVIALNQTWWPEAEISLLGLSQGKCLKVEERCQLLQEHEQKLCARRQWVPREAITGDVAGTGLECDCHALCSVPEASKPSICLTVAFPEAEVNTLHGQCCSSGSPGPYSLAHRYWVVWLCPHHLSVQKLKILSSKEIGLYEFSVYLMSAVHARVC